MLAEVLEPKIRFSHRRDRVTLLATRPQHTHSLVNKTQNTDRRLFFSLPFPYFGFCTSVFSTCPTRSLIAKLPYGTPSVTKINGLYRHIRSLIRAEIRTLFRAEIRTLFRAEIRALFRAEIRALFRAEIRALFRAEIKT